MGAAKQTPGELVRFTAGGTLTEGVPTRLGAASIVPVLDAVADDVINGYVLSHGGIYQLPKKAAVAFDEGQACYYDGQNGVITDDPAAGVYMGPCVNVGGKAAGDSLINVLFVGEPELPRDVIAEPQTLTANAATTYRIACPFKSGRLVSLSTRTKTKPASTLGAVLLTATNGTGGNNVLGAANVDAEGLTDDTVESHALTATAADLLFSIGQVLVVVLTSNNADMTGGVDFSVIAHFEPVTG